ncbi:hypothetical protein [Acinetobacter populi]|uniref:Uncharacterized protein n=1 Tax=Acinetobacter populi TaxID=1582270 RepID=A0A1Z9YXU2_9GAMM|nr:hypothetical protein [Acinetobacter populi]OUY07030.1 hypothetical protein CAP51_10075 [Acinetobacter populi]
MNAPFDPKKAPQLKPTKTVVDCLEDASCVIGTLRSALLHTVTSYEQWGLTDEKTELMLTVSINISKKFLREIDQASLIGFDYLTDFQQQMDGVIVAIEEISKFFLVKSHTVSALYGVYYAVQYIYDNLSECINNSLNTSTPIQ